MHDQDTTWGPYEIIAPLGQGGMGTVFLARHHANPEERVALKIVNSLDPRLVRRFRREIQILGSLNHPGIVGLRDHGHQADGRPWFAMELLRGTPMNAHMFHTPGTDDNNALSSAPPTEVLREHWTSRLRDVDELTRNPPAVSHSSLLRLGQASTITASGLCTTSEAEASNLWQARRAPKVWAPETCRSALESLGQVCRTLAYLHGEGIVHCDLKPENIVITEDGDAVLVDFGIASRFGARVESDVIAAAGEQAGTTHYISPEQIQGMFVDARTDLYALGCILYEILTGTVPFLHEDPAVVLRQHLALLARPPSTWVERLPHTLDRLSERLLAKRLEARLGHAFGVLRALGELGFEPTTWNEAPTPQPYLYKPQMTGRAALLRELVDDLHTTRSGKGSVWMIGGEAGVGKSRLAAELVSRARQSNLVVMYGQCQLIERRETPVVGPPLHGFIPTLRQIADDARQGGESRTMELFGEAGKVLEPYAPFLGTLPGQQDLPIPEPLPPDQGRLRVFFALTEVLERALGDLPMLFVFDDIQWADALTLDALEHLLSHVFERRPWMVLGLYASEELPTSPGGIWDDPRVYHERLERLDESSLRALISQMLGLDAAPEALAKFVIRQTEGNPFYVAEYLRLALDTGLLTMDERGRWSLERDDVSALAVPDSVQSMLTGRLERLPASAREICEAASVLGRGSASDLLAEVMGRTLSRRDLDVLTRREILTRTEDRGKVYVRFAHDKLREAAYASMDPEVRRELHKRVALRLASRREPQAGLLGHHWEQAGDVGLAKTWYEKDALRALREHALEHAAQSWGRVIALSNRADAVKQRLSLVERVLLVSGALEEARAHLEQVLRDVRREALPEARPRALNLLGDICRRMGDLRRAGRLLEEARVGFDEIASGHGKAAVFVNMGRMRQEEGDLMTARKHYDAALALYQKLKDAHGMGCALNEMGDVCVDMERLMEATMLFEQSRDLHKNLGAEHGETVASWKLGRIAWLRGSDEDAIQIITQARDRLAHLGARTDQARAEVDLFRLAMEHDDDASTLAHAHEALRLLEGLQETSRRLRVLGDLAFWHIQRGRTERARTLYLSALEAPGNALSGEALLTLERVRAALERA